MRRSRSGGTAAKRRGRCCRTRCRRARSWRPSFRLVVLLKGLFEQHPRSFVPDHNTLGLHEAGGCHTAEVAQRVEQVLNALRIEPTTVEHWHNVAARRTRLAPPRHVEQTEALLRQSVAALNALAPPFTVMTTRAQLA